MSLYPVFITSLYLRRWIKVSLSGEMFTGMGLDDFEYLGLLGKVNYYLSTTLMKSYFSMSERSNLIFVDIRAVTARCI